MESSLLRIGIVGASSLIGKELAEVLGNSPFAAANVVLLDEEEVTGQLAAVGEEASFIHRIEASSFDGMDLVFFAGKAEETRRHWTAALKTGAGVIDLMHALAGHAGVVVRSPWVTALQPDLSLSAVLPAHPVAVILGLIARRCENHGLKSIAATVLLPASERGQAGMDELHKQTVNLLSFQSLPTEEFDAQVAFNLLPALGDAAKTTLDQTTARILSDYAALGSLPEVTVQGIQAPVFHGYGLSMLLDYSSVCIVEEVESALAGEHLVVVSPESSPPANLSAAGQQEILLRVTQGPEMRVWLWAAADNLRLAAHHAIACAVELQNSRPRGKVQ